MSVISVVRGVMSVILVVSGIILAIAVVFGSRLLSHWSDGYVGFLLDLLGYVYYFGHLSGHVC